MNDPEMDDAEASYRRGYQQGAFDALAAIDRYPILRVKEWVNNTLSRWRYQDRISNRDLGPPRLK